MGPSPATSPAAMLALNSMLQPIARFCLRHGLHVQDILEAAKRALVDAGRAEMKGLENVSRLSAATGLQRRDVMRLLSEDGSQRERIGLTNRVIGQWVHDKRFRGAKNQHLELPLDGSKRSFQQLVETITQDIHPGTVLQELERLNAVERTEHGVKLLVTSFVPKAEIKESYGMLARDVSYLIDAVGENIETQPVTPNLHATVEFDNVQRKHLPAIRRWLLDEGSKFQRRVSRYLSKYDIDINPAEKADAAGGRVSCSVFSLVSEEDR